MEKLKPCPFCGKDGEILDVTNLPIIESGWIAYCKNNNCILSGMSFMADTEENIIKMWSTRHKEGDR